MIFPLIMVLSAYFFFAGHNTPGGGFAGGLTAGLALVLRYLAGGRYELGETLPLDAGKILGVGLGLSAGTAVASLLAGAPVLSSALIQIHVPVLGTVKFVTALFFDLGVYLIVVGLVLDVLRSLGAELDRQDDEDDPIELNEGEVVAVDRVTGLAIVRVEGGAAKVDVPRWTPSAVDGPRYLMATVGTSAGVSLRPVLVGALHEIESPAWPGPIWSVPEGTDLPASAFVFTTSGEIAGLVAREAPGLAIIPWDIVVDEATQVRDRGRVPPPDLRVEVRPLTSALSRATATTQGVVVAWVDPRGPLAKQVAVGDVIQSLNAHSISQLRDWEVASSRLAAGPLTIGVRRQGKPSTVHVNLPDASISAAATSLGLQMRNIPGIGASVLRIDPHSAANAARLQEGDIITLAGDITAPTAAQIGDDTLEKRSQGYAVPDSFTHGTSAQRVEAFKRGMDSGELRACGVAVRGAD